MATDQARTDVLGSRWTGRDADRLQTGLWILAVALFGLGDVVTTTTLIHVGGAEADPVFRYLFMYLPASIALAMAVAAQLAVAYAVYRHVDHPARIFIPVWLALYGTVVVVWNWTYLVGL